MKMFLSVYAIGAAPDIITQQFCKVEAIAEGKQVPKEQNQYQLLMWDENLSFFDTGKNRTTSPKQN